MGGSSALRGSKGHYLEGPRRNCRHVLCCAAATAAKLCCRWLLHCWTRCCSAFHARVVQMPFALVPVGTAGATRRPLRGVMLYLALVVIPVTAGTSAQFHGSSSVSLSVRRFRTRNNLGSQPNFPIFLFRSPMLARSYVPRNSQGSASIFIPVKRRGVRKRRPRSKGGGESNVREWGGVMWGVRMHAVRVAVSVVVCVVVGSRRPSALSACCRRALCPPSPCVRHVGRCHVRPQHYRTV